MEPTDKSSPSAPTSSTGHQIWPFSDLVSYYKSMIDSYIPLPFPFFLGCNSDYILFSKELRLRRWRMDAGHGEWWYMAHSTNPKAENSSSHDDINICGSEELSYLTSSIGATTAFWVEALSPTNPETLIISYSFFCNMVIYIRLVFSRPACC